MPLSHTETFSSTSNEDIFDQLPYSVKSIYKRTRTEEFTALEKKLHPQFAEAERYCMARLLEQYDWDYPAFTSGGKIYRKASRNKKSYMTLAGKVTLKRTLYRTTRNA